MTQLQCAWQNDVHVMGLFGMRNLRAMNLGKEISKEQNILASVWPLCPHVVKCKRDKNGSKMEFIIPKEAEWKLENS